MIKSTEYYRVKVKVMNNTEWVQVACKPAPAVAAALCARSEAATESRTFTTE